MGEKCVFWDGAFVLWRFLKEGWKDGMGWDGMTDTGVITGRMNV